MTSMPFRPPRRTLMGPGPSDVDPRVLAAMAQPTIGHLDPVFLAMMEQLKERLRYAFRTANPVTFPISAPGSAGMEACLVNLVEEGDEVVVCRNGVFGDRMREVVERIGATPVLVDDAWGEPIDPEKLERALLAHPHARTVAFVHAETSTGVESDAQMLAEVAHDHDALVIVDAVTSLGGTPVETDAWELDVVYGGSQKCLSVPPGLAPVTFGPAALERVRHRRTKARSWFLDLDLLLGYWDEEGGRSYHHTAPVNALYGMNEGLRLLEEECIENAWSRHRRDHEVLRAGLEAMGLSLTVPEAHRLPQLNAVSIPDGVDDAEVRRRLLEEHGLEIGAGLGTFAGKVWRIGLMGHACTIDNVNLCLGALDAVLSSSGAPVHTGAALPAARLKLTSMLSR